MARALLLRPLTMDALEAQLAIAEFEETWREVRYHEGRASVADVEEAIRRVNALRRLADDVARRQATGASLSWPAPRATAPAGN